MLQQRKMTRTMGAAFISAADTILTSAKAGMIALGVPAIEQARRAFAGAGYVSA